jgi:hypothetical protein
VLLAPLVRMCVCMCMCVRVCVRERQRERVNIYVSPHTHVYFISTLHTTLTHTYRHDSHTRIPTEGSDAQVSIAEFFVRCLNNQFDNDATLGVCVFMCVCACIHMCECATNCYFTHSNIRTAHTHRPPGRAYRGRQPHSVRRARLRGIDFRLQGEYVCMCAVSVSVL